jgi:hypothetical protein
VKAEWIRWKLLFFSFMVEKKRKLECDCSKGNGQKSTLESHPLVLIPRICAQFYDKGMSGTGGGMSIQEE